MRDDMRRGIPSYLTDIIAGLVTFQMEYVSYSLIDGIIAVLEALIVFSYRKRFYAE